jgi:hypothetical protein
MGGAVDVGPLESRCRSLLQTSALDLLPPTSAQVVVAVVVGVGMAVAEETESPGVIHAHFVYLVSQEGQAQFHPQFV